MEKYFIEHCSPTLASIKTANLFTIDITSEKELEIQLNIWSRIMNPKGIEIKVLNIMKNRALIYVYRREMLLKDWRKDEVKLFMKKYGYFSDDEINVECAIQLLIKRFSENEEFPHEIGLFLGYPLKDVSGFIENSGKNSKCCGFWKVYCNECETLKTFEKYRKCIKIYSELWRSGRSILKLTVAA